MANDKNIKNTLHPHNKNRERYDIDALVHAVPALKDHIVINKSGQKSINFSDSQAVKLLNKALLFHYYKIVYWDFPKHNLTPPIPGRAEYIHHIADYLAADNGNQIPRGSQFTCLDIGVGASCIYPIIGVTEYDWNFLASDIDFESVESARNIVAKNSSLKNQVKVNLQKNKNYFFKGIINQEDKIDLVMCNPPFHASIEEAEKGTKRKNINLAKHKKNEKLNLNFSGNQKELIYPGGEAKFIQKMIKESRNFGTTVYLFSVLVSKQSNLKKIQQSLHINQVFQSHTITLQTAHKTSRIVTWTFLDKKQQKLWRDHRWAKIIPPN